MSDAIVSLILYVVSKLNSDRNIKFNKVPCVLAKRRSFLIQNTFLRKNGAGLLGTSQWAQFPGPIVGEFSCCRISVL